MSIMMGFIFLCIKRVTTSASLKDLFSPVIFVSIFFDVVLELE